MLSLLQEDLQLLRETVQSQHAEICSLNRNIEKLRKENKELKQRLAKHEDPNKNSSNSSTPPSKENLKEEILRRTSSLRKKSDKSVGGQPGHKGVVRGLVENPDEIIDEQASFCTECGESLKDAQKVLDYTGLKNMVAVTDRHSAYFAINFLSHQVCLAHLLREIQYLNELDKNQKRSKDLENLLQEAIHYRNEHPTEIVDTQSWLDRPDSILQQNVEHLKEGFGILKNGLIKCRDYIF